MPSSEHNTQHAGHEVDETVSLLASHRHDDGDDVTSTTARTLMSRRAAAKERSYTKTHFLILITLVVFIIDIAFCLVDAPQVEIFEHIICNAYYKGNPAVLTSNPSDWMKASPSCVVDAVQSELAILTQFKDMLDMLISLVMAVPYGILAETFGRKPIILLISMIGIAAELLIDVLICWLPQVFRLRIIWITPLLQILGGGISVTNSMIYTMLADFLEPADRARAFYLISASSLLGGVTGNTLAATLMRISSWVPIMIGAGIISLSPLLILLLPETMKPMPCYVDTSTILTQPATNSTRRLRVELQDLWTRLNMSLGVVFKSTNVMLLMDCGPVKLAPTAICTESFWLELFALLAFGSLLFALSSETLVLVASISLITLGDGIEVAMRSLLTSLIPPPQISTVYTGVAVVSGAGGIIAGPILAMTFKVGMRAGGRWLALTFYVVAALFFLILMAVCSVQLRKTDDNMNATSSDGGFDDYGGSSVERDQGD